MYLKFDVYRLIRCCGYGRHNGSIKYLNGLRYFNRSVEWAGDVIYNTTDNSCIVRSQGENKTCQENTRDMAERP